MNTMSGIQTITFADLQGPQGPFLLQARLGAFTNRPRWVDQEWVKSAEHGLQVASKMCSTYDYRLYLGKEWGYLHLEWVEDEADTDYCKPVWVRKD